MKKNILGRTNISVSPIGFGCYRVADEVEEHHEALEYALETGINLIDTSANYTDGSSEKLIGNTLIKLESEQNISRDEIVVVTKSGYMQGKNYEIAVEREERGNPFPEVVKYQQGLWHCIHPEFLEDQITRSLERLQLDYVDVYLLHNPEYYLSWAKKNDTPLVEARGEYYRRIKEAFIWLESEVMKGRIKWYGISSNTFPTQSDTYEHTSIETVLSIAKDISANHHCAVIQFPMNLYEYGAATIKNQKNSTQTLLSFAVENNIGVLINRPLNAFHNNRLIRLADPTYVGDVSQNEILTAIRTLSEQESSMHNIMSQEVQDSRVIEHLPKLFCVGEFLSKNYSFIESREYLNDIYGRELYPRFQFTRQIIEELPTATDQLQQQFHYYNSAFRNAIETLTAFVSNKALVANQEIHSQLSHIFSQRSEGLHSEDVIHSFGGYPDSIKFDATLSQKSLLALCNTEGLCCTLLGMRKVDYVDDAHVVMAHLDKERFEFDWDKWSSLISEKK